MLTFWSIIKDWRWEEISFCFAQYRHFYLFQQKKKNKNSSSCHTDEKQVYMTVYWFMDKKHNQLQKIKGKWRWSEEESCCEQMSRGEPTVCPLLTGVLSCWIFTKQSHSFNFLKTKCIGVFLQLINTVRSLRENTTVSLKAATFKLY